MKQDTNQWATKQNPNQSTKMRSMGFVKYAEAGIGTGGHGFAQIVRKKKRSKGANVGDVNGFNSISQKSKDGFEITKTIEKAGYNENVRMRRFKNLSEITPDHSGQCVPTHSGKRSQAQSGQSLAQSGQNLPAHSSGQRVPNKPAQHIPPNQSRQITPPNQTSNQSEQHAQSQSKQHSPAQSFQHASQSGQSTRDQSRQLTAQSHQLTPEAQSRQPSPAAQSEPREHTPALSHPSTFHVSSTAANDYMSWDIGSTQKDGRIRVEVINKVLEPSNKCSSLIKKIMYEKLDPTGYNWKSISKETQRFYFEEFKKYFVWRQEDAIIYQGWLANARRKYSELCCLAHTGWVNQKPPDNRIGMNVYLSWIEFWKTSRCIEISAIQKGNRCSGVDGRPSTHTSGSASHRTMAARMKMQYKRNPTAAEVFREGHIRHLKKKKNLSYGNDENDENSSDDEVIWIDQKSQQIYETYLSLREQQLKSGQPVDENALFFQAAGGFDKKKRVYGVGSSQNLFYPSEVAPCTSPFAQEENQKLQQELKEMKDRVKEVENQLAIILEATTSRIRQSPHSNVDSQDGDH